jgi:hypothetical protein
MKRARQRIWVLGIWIAAVHFAASQLIIPLTAAVAARATPAADVPGLAVTLLVRLTKLLHLPLVTLALYPREWFPGNWVYVPMALDSAVWAGVACAVIRLIRKKA